MRVSPLTSKTISALRLPLIIGVMFIHNSSAELPGMNLSEVINSVTCWGGVNYIIKLVSGTLAACAVPIFFFFSGYLFFIKTDEFCREEYYGKIKSRLNSLLVPYIFWAIFGVTLYGLLATLPYTKQIFGNGYFEFSWRYIGEQITGLKLVDGVHIFQIGYHLWFLRDLFFMVILSPLFYLALRNRRWLIWLMIAVWIFSGATPWLREMEINTTSFIFFGLGAYFGINNLDFLSLFQRFMIASSICYPVFVIIDWLIVCNFVDVTYVSFLAPIIKASMILLALPFWCNVVALLVSRRLIRDVEWLAAASFFIYLIHIPFILPQVKKILYHLVNPQTQEVLVVLYFGTVFMSVIVCMMIYKLMQLVCPRLLLFVTGGHYSK